MFDIVQQHDRKNSKATQGINNMKAGRSDFGHSLNFDANIYKMCQNDNKHIKKFTRFEKCTDLRVEDMLI